MDISEHTRKYLKTAGDSDELAQFSNTASLGLMTVFSVALVPFGMGEKMVAYSEVHLALVVPGVLGQETFGYAYVFKAVITHEAIGSWQGAGAHPIPFSFAFSLLFL